MAQPLRVLLVEDNPPDAELVVTELRRAGFEPEWRRVDTEQGFIESLDQKLDVILSDCDMPQFNGLRALDLLQKSGLEVPFIIVSGTIREETAVASMRRGAADYLLKDRLSRLGQSVGKAVEQSRLRKAERRFSEELKQAEARYRSIFENAVEGIYQSTPDGRLLSVNPALVRILGYESPEELAAVVSDFRLALNVDQERRSEFQRLIETNGMVLRFEAQARRKDGSLIWISENTRMARDGDNAAHYEGMVEDITERRRTEEELRQVEEQLRQSQKMEAIGRLAGGIAHDFNNLLTVINTYAEVAMSRLPDGHRICADLREIHKAGDRAAALTHQLLAFGRKQVMQPRVLNLNNAVSDMKKMLRRVIGEDIDLIADLAPDAHNIKADPGQIEQILMNLAVNSRDAMPFGGQLIIRTSNVELDEPRAGQLNASRGRYVRLSIEDTGCGMEQSTLEQIFEPFFTTKDVGKGTGLGLATVYGIVKQSGAHISVSSEPDEGTTFEIYWSVAEEVFDSVITEAALDPRSVKAGLSDQSIGGETILLVEDEEPVRDLVEQVLSSAGYVVYTAGSGSEALGFCEQFNEPLHLIMTDVIMPQMSGPELAGRLLEMIPGLKVLYASGYTDDAILRHGISDSPAHFIPKPFNIGALTQKVREVLDSKPAQVDDNRKTLVYGGRL
ncbi:MAG: hybrid sensor histidine kinase/response regulator [Blastocatellia bacterium AA13]|nr:MAG: hybrid sensor histidine kinase/response regulator [Blastocatellia bacterium AA13]